MKLKRTLITLFIFVLANIGAYAQKGYEKRIEIGTSIGVGEYTNTSFGASMINGYRFNDYFFIGAGVGVGYSNALTLIEIKDGTTKELRNDAVLIPIYANLKANLTKSRISPFLHFNIGYTFDAMQYAKDAPGLMIEPALGIDFKFEKTALYASFGFKLQHHEYSYMRNVGALDDNWDIETCSELSKSISIKLGIKF